MEWYQNRVLQPQNIDQCIHIVKGIFELGLRNPGVQAEPDYIHLYARWLVSTFPVLPLLEFVAFAFTGDVYVSELEHEMYNERLWLDLPRSVFE
jgi:hypothetical protein